MVPPGLRHQVHKAFTNILKYFAPNGLVSGCWCCTHGMSQRSPTPKKQLKVNAQHIYIYIHINVCIIHTYTHIHMYICILAHVYYLYSLKGMRSITTEQHDKLWRWSPYFWPPNSRVAFYWYQCTHNGWSCSLATWPLGIPEVVVLQCLQSRCVASSSWPSPTSQWSEVQHPSTT